MRFMTLWRPGKKSNANTPQMQAEMGKLIEEMTKSGQLLQTGGWDPNGPRTVVTNTGNEMNVTDGPFAEAKEMINSARQPVILADVEVHRFSLQDELLRLARKTNIPVAATVLGKSVIGEQHPFYLGIYEGAMGRDDVRQYVEDSDCLIMLGAFMTDINLGVYTARLDPARSISATSEKLSIRYHNYEDVRFKDFVDGLLRLPLRRRKLGKIPQPKPPVALSLAKSDQPAGGARRHRSAWPA